MPPSAASPSRWDQFLGLRSAQLVDQLQLHCPPLHLALCRLLPAGSLQKQHLFDSLLSDDESALTPREIAVRLLDALKGASDEVRMAFCCALVECGALAVFGEVLKAHLVDLQRLEQFAKARATKTVAELMADCRAEEDAENQLQPKAVPVSEFQSTLNRKEFRKKFVERHAELLCLKLTEVPTVAELLSRWTVLDRAQFGRLVKSQIDPSAQCHALVALLAEEGALASHAYECFCLALLLTLQFRLYSIFHEHADPKWMETVLAQFMEQFSDEHIRRLDLAEEEGEGEGGGRDSPQWEPAGVLAQLRVEAVDMDSADGEQLGTFVRQNPDNIYPNYSTPRGLALIINNYRFARKDRREGTNVDCENLHNLLVQLRYKVIVAKDLTGGDMMMAIRDFAARREHASAHSAVVAVMSHGEYDTLLGTDDAPVNLHEFVAVLNAKNAPQLNGKPKMFIVQACRGKNFDYGVQRAVLGGHPSGDVERPDGGWQFLSWLRPKKRGGPLHFPLSRNNSPQQSFASGGSRRPSSAEQHLHWVNEPTNADILIAQSTPPHFVSWRHSQRGSWFVQTLCEVFSRWARSEDVLSMLTRVHDQVAHIVGTTGRTKQVPETTTTLRKRFYFFPGLNEALV